MRERRIKRLPLRPIGTVVSREPAKEEGCMGGTQCESVVGQLDDGTRVRFINRCPRHWFKADESRTELSPTDTKTDTARKPPA